MRTPFLKRRAKEDKPTTPDKPPYATAPLSRNIPANDPKPRVNANYKKPLPTLKWKLVLCIIQDKYING